MSITIIRPVAFAAGFVIRVTSSSVGSKLDAIRGLERHGVYVRMLTCSLPREIPYVWTDMTMISTPCRPARCLVSTTARLPLRRAGRLLVSELDVELGTQRATSANHRRVRRQRAHGRRSETCSFATCTAVSHDHRTAVAPHPAHRATHSLAAEPRSWRTLAKCVTGALQALDTRVPHLVVTITVLVVVAGHPRVAAHSRVA